MLDRNNAVASPFQMHQTIEQDMCDETYEVDELVSMSSSRPLTASASTYERDKIVFTP